MSHIEKRGSGYRARFSDPTGKQHSRPFSRKSDAQRFLRELDADMLRGAWVDPRDADTALADWADEFLSPCRPPRRTNTGDVPPRPDQVRAASLWDVPDRTPPSRGDRELVEVEKQRILTNPCDRVDPPRVPEREMLFLDRDEVMTLAGDMSERYRTMIVFAVDSGMRSIELVGLRRHKIDLASRKVG